MRAVFLADCSGAAGASEKWAPAPRHQPAQSASLQFSCVRKAPAELRKLLSAGTKSNIFAEGDAALSIGRCSGRALRHHLHQRAARS